MIRSSWYEDVVAQNIEQRGIATTRHNCSATCWCGSSCTSGPSSTRTRLFHSKGLVVPFVLLLVATVLHVLALILSSFFCGRSVAAGE